MEYSGFFLRRVIVKIRSFLSNLKFKIFSYKLFGYILDIPLNLYITI